ncbi:GNAT family N-acetyltransferase [Candidatus Protochlamydia phocaeensis]|uniref:GNAT family N-acetyltransferase n=1 Tax=Candidatus Protochlamydia phocaeensis TaxID=1414722 RepID=UPI0009AC00BB|nr:GNAT family N-acetyltransferase [Candidatus Protochlamydia phocaeensis]
MQYMPTSMITNIYPSYLEMESKNMETRITLRSLSRDDLKCFYTWASDPEVAQTMTWEAYSSEEEAYKFLVEVAEKHSWFKAICLDGVPIGSVTLSQGKGNAACRAELGYVLAKAYWGKGIATLAVKNAIKQGFNDLGVKRIEALVDPENISSQKVLAKAGLSCEGLLKNYILFKGEMRDRYIYAIVN